MAVQNNSPALRSLYRRFLREIPAAPGHRILASPSTVQRHIRSKFAAPEPAAAEIERRIKYAEQYAEYLKSQRMYLTLIERYNPGMGMDETERVRLSARRVGMNLPVEGKPL